MEEEKKIIISIDPNDEVDLEDDCLLPIETNNEDTLDLSELVKKVQEEGDKSE